MPGAVSLSDSKGKFFQYGCAHDEFNSCCLIESSQTGIFSCIFPIFLAPSGIPFGDKTVGRNSVVIEWLLFCVCFDRETSVI